MYFSIHWCFLKVVINNIRNMWEWFTIRGQVKFVGNKLIHVCQLHRPCTILSVLKHPSVIIPVYSPQPNCNEIFPPLHQQHEPEAFHRTANAWSANFYNSKMLCSVRSVPASSEINQALVLVGPFHGDNAAGAQVYYL